MTITHARIRFLFGHSRVADSIPHRFVPSLALSPIDDTMGPPPSATVLLRDDDANAAPRYDVTAASALAIAGTFSAGRMASGGRQASASLSSASRGSTVSTKARSSFIIAAVTENRAREIGACACVAASGHPIVSANIASPVLTYWKASALSTWCLRTSCSSGASSTPTRMPRRCHCCTRTRYDQWLHLVFHSLC